MYSMHVRRAFSLIELSIVIVILGLIVGGVIAGQALVKGSELNRFVTSMKQYEIAVSSFYEKYNALPGDMPNATSFWGLSATGACPNATGTGTCNGDGNGKIENCSSGCSIREHFRVFEQLSKAELIGGGYSYNVLTYPQNVAKISVQVQFFYVGPLSGAGTPARSSLYGRTGHAFMVGKGGAMSDGFVSAEDMWNIDTKADDGHPYNGRVMAAQSLDGNADLSSQCTTSGNFFSQTGSASTAYDFVRGRTERSCIAAFLYDEDN